jgi:hypothetical protein
VQSAKISEAGFQRTVIELATLHHWRVFHSRPARHRRRGVDTWSTPIQGPGAGFLDLVLSRGPRYAVRILVAELKLEHTNPNSEQMAWLAAFEAMGIPAYIWRPADWPQIKAILTRED